MFLILWQLYQVIQVVLNESSNIVFTKTHVIVDKITIFTNYGYQNNDLIDCENVNSKNINKQKKLKNNITRNSFWVFFTTTWNTIKKTMNKSVGIDFTKPLIHRY